MTFAKKAYNFYKTLESPSNLPSGISVMNPYTTKSTLNLTKAFLDKFFPDDFERVFVLGINPGRFGGGYTGINFTDGFALEEFCGIKNDLVKKRELSSVFVYEVIKEWGGADKFYKKFFLTAISPLGFLKNGLNYNYYDDKHLSISVRGFIVENLKKQIEFGAKRKTAILFGTGQNQKYFNDLNHEFYFFEKVFSLEHPRFIMQYKRSSIKEYIDKYLFTFNEAVNTS